MESLPHCTSWGNHSTMMTGIRLQNTQIMRGTVTGNLLGALIRFMKTDARHFQILYLSIFLLYGIFALNWTTDIPKFAVIIGTCLGAEAAGILMMGGNWNRLKSAMISALGLCLLMYANSLWTYALAGALTISGKYLIRFNGKHLFNPNNFGILLAIWFTGDAWISPGQWGSDALLVYFFGAAAIIVLLKVGRLDTSLAFLGTFMGLQFCRSILFLGWPVDHFIHQFSSGSILLFSFFMITDPVTTPGKTGARIAWAAMVGAISFFLSNWLHVHTAPVYALFFITPLTVILDWYFRGNRFHWIRPGVEKSPGISPKIN